MNGPLIVTPHPGPETQRTLERLRESEVGAGLTYGISDQPVVLGRASGAVIEDPDGNRFLDMVAGFGSLNLGHSHPRLVEAASAQLALGQQAMSIAATVRTDLVERLATLVDGDHRVILAASGSEAVEAALKLARRATGRQGVVAFSGGFHGRTMGALTLMGRRSQREGLGTLTAGVVHLPYPDAFRSPFGDRPEEVAATTLAMLEQQLGDPASGWTDVGAVVIEAVQGNGGMIPAPVGFLSGLRRVCDTHGVLLVVDEVMSGFHRTGRRFAFERDSDVRPDIVVMGKSLSAGLPLAGCLVAGDVADASPPGTESSTYAGNLVSCASALAALDVYEEDGMSARADRLGRHLVGALEETVGGHPRVGEIRGAGLMVGVELVGEGREPLPAARLVSDDAVRRGLLTYPGGHHGNVVSFLPPLIVSGSQLETAAAMVADSLAAVV